MSYTPQTWVNGDIITATKLNNIESGVQSVSNSYTPTTWVNGDIITAVKLNNIEQGIANAGGGASDFSTAEVTFVNNATEGIYLYAPACYAENEMGEGAPALCSPQIILGTGTTSLSIAMYKGTAYMIEGTQGLSFAVTGDILDGGGIFLITGDGTITIS